MSEHKTFMESGMAKPGTPAAAPRHRSLKPTALILFALISLPLADAVFHFVPRPALTENRALAPRPRFRWAGLRTFPREMEDYYADHFGTRNILIRWASAFKIRVLHVSPKRSVVLGCDGWLFLGQEGVNRDVMGYHRGLIPFSADELTYWMSVLKRRRDWLDRRGIEYLLVISPDKSTVYPEYLPARLRSGLRPTRRLQLLSELRAHARIPVLDLVPRLEEAKTERKVFLKTDSHWNGYGAFIGYRDIVRRLAADFPALSPEPLSDFIIKDMEQPGGDLARMINGEDFLRDDAIDLLPRCPRRASAAMVTSPSRPGVEWSATEHPNRGLPRAVMFLDSFGLQMRDFLSEHFSRIVYVRDKDLAFDDGIVIEEKPDLVIEEINERFLLGWAPQNPSSLNR
jgi:alginate O-acetyltransferase complex protein AlgJ